MRSTLMIFCLLILSVGLTAGNRADINADQAVTSLDAVILSNILAGNMDVANYDLERVVVVAPQGGDFTSPVDAAAWVATQSPSETSPYVILVTPGDYTTYAPVELPDHTTLRGYGPERTRIHRYGGDTASENTNATVLCSGLASATIENILIERSSFGSGKDIAVYIEDCIRCTLRNVHCQATGIDTNAVALWASGSNDRYAHSLEIRDSKLEATGFPGTSDRCTAMYLTGNIDSRVVDSDLVAQCLTGNSGTPFGIGFFCAGHTLRVYHSRIRVEHPAAGSIYAIYVWGGDSYLYGCHVQNGTVGVFSGETAPVTLYCHSDTGVWP